MLPSIDPRSWLRWLIPVLTVITTIVGWSQFTERNRQTFAREATDIVSSEPARKAWGNSVGFESERRLDEHYRKHGAEFGNITKIDYLHQAQLLRDTAVGGPVIEIVRRDGVTTRFDRETGAFVAFNRDGTIRTFFKPNDGERYFRRQAERGGE